LENNVCVQTFSEEIQKGTSWLVYIIVHNALWGLYSYSKINDRIKCKVFKRARIDLYVMKWYKNSYTINIDRTYLQFTITFSVFNYQIRSGVSGISVFRHYPLSSKIFNRLRKTCQLLLSFDQTMKVEKTLVHVNCRLWTLMQLLFSFDQAMKVEKTLMHVNSRLPTLVLVWSNNESWENSHATLVLVSSSNEVEETLIGELCMLSRF
jgi:hypothetical protein